tara:strand:+ start:237 stop:545 length:309 start_codon:yes stop_codon:yes gene_type:complete
MRRKKRQPRIAVKCDYCNSETETFVVTAEYKKFCIIQTPGYPAEKDCMEDYLNEKKKEKQSIYAQKEKQFQEEKEKVLTDKTTAIKKLAELQQFLNKKSRQL